MGGSAAEHVGRVVLQPQGVLGYSGAHRDFPRLVGSNFHVQLRVDGVHRVRGRLHQVDIAKAFAREVAHRAVEARHRLMIRAVVDGVQSDAVLERRDERERLEGGAGLGDVLGGGVALDFQIVGAAIHAGHRPRLGVHRDRGDAQVGGRVLRHLRHRVFDRLLRGGDERGHDAQATRSRLLLA